MNLSRVRVVATLLATLIVSLLPLNHASAAATYTVDGNVEVSGIDVRFYRSSTGNEEGPYELAETVTSRSGGGYAVQLSPGTYRATFNEVETSDINSRLRGSAVATDFWSGKEVFVVEDQRLTLNAASLPYKADTLTGTFGDVCDNDPNQPGFVEGYAADDPDPAHASRWTVPSYNRGFEVHGFAGPTKFKIVLPHHEPYWIGGDSFETATAYTLEPGSPQTAPTSMIIKTFDPESEGHISGTVRLARTGDGIAGLSVRYYHSASGTASGPWNLVGQSTSAAGTATGSGRGRYGIDVPAGLYRVTVNEFPDGGIVSRSYRTATFKSRTAPGSNDGLENIGNVCVDDESTSVPGPYVNYKGGTIAGTVTDRRGKPVSDVTVSLFSADTSGTGDHVVRTVKSQYDGTYSIQSIDGPVKLQFSPGKKSTQGGDAYLHRAEWSGDAVDAAHAATITAADDQTVTSDVTLADAPITILKRPRIDGRLRVGQRQFGDAGFSSLDPHFSDEPTASKKYQWLRNSGSTSTPIKGATKLSYTPTIRDLGHTLSLRVTFVPPKSVPGVASVSAISKPSKIVRTTSSARASAKAAGSRRFTITGKIGIKGKKKPSGTAYVQWVGLKLKGDRFVLSGKTHTKKVHYRHGRLTYSVKTSRAGYWAYAVIVPETTTVIGSDDVNYLKLKK